MDNINNIVFSILIKFYPEYKVVKKMKFHTSVGHKRKPHTLYNYLQNHSIEETIEWFSSIVEKEKTRGTQKWFTDRFGTEEGTRKYLEKNSKLSVSEASLRNNGKTEEEIKIIRNIHKTKSKHDEATFLRVYGDKGTQKLEKWKKKSRHRSSRCVEYWMERGFSNEEAIQQVAKVQTRDKTFFENSKNNLSFDYAEYCNKKTIGIRKEGYIFRFGEIDGPIQYVEDKKKASNVEYYKQKYGEDQGEIVFQQVMKKKVTSFVGKCSTIQKTFTEDLYNSLDDSYKPYFYGHPITNDFWINYSTNRYGLRCSVPDIRIKNILIEFDGDYWHSLLENKTRDVQKDELNKQLGYVTLRIPEHTYRTTPVEVIQNTIDFINQNILLDFKQKFKHNTQV